MVALRVRAHLLSRSEDAVKRYFASTVFGQVPRSTFYPHYRFNNRVSAGIGRKHVVCCPQVLSRCPIFQQYPVKMPHLSAVPCHDVPSFSRKHAVCCVLSLSAVKMPHVSALPCQDVPSFSRKHVVCCVLSSSAVKMPHLSAVPCQDVPSFSRKHVVCCVLSSSAVKMPHLSLYMSSSNVVILQVLC